MVTLDDQSGEPSVFSRELRTSCLVIRPASLVLSLDLARVKVPLEGVSKLADVVPDANIVTKLARAEVLSEIGGRSRHPGQVDDEIVPNSLSVSGMRECHLFLAC